MLHVAEATKKICHAKDEGAVDPSKLTKQVMKFWSGCCRILHSVTLTSYYCVSSFLHVSSSHRSLFLHVSPYCARTTSL